MVLFGIVKKRGTKLVRISKKKQKQNNDWAIQWLMRAKQDFGTFKILVKFDKKTRATVRCSDPALAVYLLQRLCPH